jgi:hypothetical protein
MAKINKIIAKAEEAQRQLLRSRAASSAAAAERAINRANAAQDATDAKMAANARAAAEAAARAAAARAAQEAAEKSPLNTSLQYSSPTTREVSPQPLTPATITTASVGASLPPAPPVKTAPIDTVLFNTDELPIEVMTDLIFEDIGGQELVNIARNDIINGQQVSYQPIKNLASIQQQYNPNNIVSLQSTSDKYFANFSIKLDNKIPDLGTGTDGSYVYLDNNTGDLVIEAINLESDEQIEVEIAVSGTIYEAEFGEIVS